MTNEDIKARLEMIRSGDLGLSETFWVYFLSIAALLFVAGMALGPFGGMFHLAAAGWTIFMVRPVFKAANQYQGNKGFVYAAKGGIVVFAIFAILGILSATIAYFGALLPA